MLLNETRTFEGEQCFRNWIIERPQWVTTRIWSVRTLQRDRDSMKLRYSEVFRVANPTAKCVQNGTKFLLTALQRVSAVRQVLFLK
jgi:hypothetical protein